MFAEDGLLFFIETNPVFFYKVSIVAWKDVIGQILLWHQARPGPQVGRQETRYDSKDRPSPLN
jgi:hypothetical protein